MEAVEGLFYHMKDSFFELVTDEGLMRNKENGCFRPHCLAVHDAQNEGIVWMVPVSSKVEKYRYHHDRQIAKYGRCTKIVLGKCAGRDAAFLVQNAFPTIPDYLDHAHMANGVPVTSHEGTRKNVERCLRGNLLLHKRGVELFYPDIDRIYELMIEKLARKVDC